MNAHSDKGLKTLEMMGTSAGDWSLTPIKWVRETRDLPVKVSCPTCYGSGQVHLEADGSVAVNALDNTGRAFESCERQNQIFRLPKGKCPTCPERRNWRSVGTGTIEEIRPVKVWIGYPQWEAGTLFDSRFIANGSDVCQLCAKVIKASGFVPVHGKDSSGRVHGMWVGQDCARKFLGITKWKKDSTSFVNEHTGVKP